MHTKKNLTRKMKERVFIFVPVMGKVAHLHECDHLG